MNAFESCRWLQGGLKNRLMLVQPYVVGRMVERCCLIVIGLTLRFLCSHYIIQRAVVPEVGSLGCVVKELCNSVATFVDVCVADVALPI